MTLNPEQEAEQLTLLREIRTRHHMTFTNQGIDRRIMDAGVPVNRLTGITNEVTEATLLVASRRRLGSLAIDTLFGDEMTIGGSCDRIEDMFGFCGEYPKSNLIIMSRFDATSRGGWRQCYFSVGIQQVDANGPSGELFPLDGIGMSDLGAITEMVTELEMLRASGKLSCLSEEGLMNDTIPVRGPIPLP